MHVKLVASSESGSSPLLDVQVEERLERVLELVVMFSSVVCDATEAEGGEGKGGGRAGPRDGPWRVEEVCDVVCDCDSVHGRVCCC